MMARAAKGEGTAYKTAEGKWRGYVTVDGKRKYFSAPTKAEAARKRRALLHQRDTGHLVAGKVPTVAAWLDHWMTVTGPDRAESTNMNYRSYIKNYIVKPLGSKTLDKLTMDDLERLYADMEAEGYSGSTRHQTHAIIRGALKHAVWRGHVGRNVAALVKPPAVEKKPVPVFSEADMTAIYKTIKGDPLEARWLLSLDFTLRPGEAIAPEWSHIDFDNCTITVEQQIIQISGKGAQLFKFTKTDSGRRVIALPAYMMELFKNLRTQQMLNRAAKGDEWKEWSPDGEPHAFVFTRTDGSPILPGYDSTQWKKVLERAGIPHARRYTARHTAISTAVADGDDIASVSEMAGHATPAFTLGTYTHPIEERKKMLAKAAADRRAARLNA